MRIFIRITDEMNGATFLSIYICVYYLCAFKKPKQKGENNTRRRKKNIIIIPNNYQCLIY